MRVNIGCDPEFLILNDKGRPVPAHKVGIGDKKNPTKVKGGSYFRDGFVVEVNTRPNTCRALLENDVRSVLNSIQKALPVGFTLTTRSAFKIRRGIDLKNAPEDVKKFGCEPSYDGYSGTTKTVLLDGEIHPARYAGGHIHFSTEMPRIDDTGKAVRGYYASEFDKKKPEYVALGNRDNYPAIAQLFDKYVGLPITYLYDSPEQFARRMFYGQAGEYRPQEYVKEDSILTGYKADGWTPKYTDIKVIDWGFEYRTPPSEMWNHNAVLSMVYGVGGWILQNFTKLEKTLDSAEQESIREFIQTGKGWDRPLPAVENYYDDTVLKALKLRPEIYGFNLKDGKVECHDGWNEYAAKWKVGGDVVQQVNTFA